MKVQSQSHLIPYFRPQDSSPLLPPGKWDLSSGQEPWQGRFSAKEGRLGEERYRYYLKSAGENDIYNVKRSMVSQEASMTGRLIDVYA